MTSPMCIFRYMYNDGARCMAQQLSEDCKYCKKHKNKSNYIFELMDVTLSKDNVNNERDLYEIFAYIYDNDLDLENPDEANKKKLFFAIVAYLLSKSTLLSILYKTICLNGQTNSQVDLFHKKTKRNVITYVYDILMNTYKLAKSDKNIYYICKIQRWARRHLYRKIIEYNKSPPENTEDPFTYDSIDEIPDDHKFSYKDNNGHIYIFNAVEFEYYLRNLRNLCSNETNPYTKEQLPTHVINRLYLLLKYNQLKLKQDNECKWHTALQAYTDVSLSMERAGFYTSVEWFEKITFDICKNIISSYKRICGSAENPFFITGFELNRATYTFDFCKEILNLFKEADEHYFLCCNFVKALASNVKEFRQNMPSWLNDNDQYNTSISARIYTNASDTALANTLLFMYVQDMLETMDDFDMISRRQINLVNGNISRIVFER